ncbi:MAG: M56 family metallopeptidase [Oscillospiraceae bacterium]|nr:M56 family metallopeptidase [Oscillospiraceae bacterium]
MLENIFLDILVISLTSTAAIAAILLISKLSENKFRKKWRYWIWIFLAVYLIIPVKINLPSAPIKMEVPPHEMIFTQSPEVSEEPVFVPEAEEPVLSEHEEIPLAPDLSTEDPALSTEPKTFVFPVVFVGAIIWISGAAIVCGWNIAMYIRFLSRSKPWNREVKDEFVLGLFECIKKEMGVPEKVKIYENRLIKSPMMVGFGKPRVLLPSEALLPEEYEFVLRHELTHYKRGDLWYKMLLMLAASVHWFNPFIGFMCRNAENDIEITCDEAVVKAMEGDRRQEYCATILNIMRRGQNSPLLLSTSFYGGKKFLKSRFAAVLNPKTHRGIALFIIAAMVIVISGTMVACNSETVPEEPQEIAEIVTKEDAVSEAEKLIESVYLNMNLVEEKEYDAELSEEAKNQIEELVASENEAIELGYGKWDVNEYETEIIFQEGHQSGILYEMVFQVIERYYVTQQYTEDRTEDDMTIVSRLVKVTYNFAQKEFVKFLVRDLNWFGEDLIGRPEVTGPDENGNFPLISHADWDRWISYNGEPQTEDEKPNGPISSVLECPEYLEYLEKTYPRIDDWEIIYETADYELVHSYDPYNYCYREIYMPRRFAVLKTEQSEDFDRLFVSTHEVYEAYYTDEGYIPQKEFYSGNNTAFEADIQVGNMEGAEIYDTFFTYYKGLWFPEEEKTIVFDTARNEAFAVYGTKEPIHVYVVEALDYSYDVNDRRIELSENWKRYYRVGYSLTNDNFRENMSIALYDLETKRLVQFEGLEDYSGWIYQCYWLDSDKFVFDTEGVLYLYNAEEPTKLVAKIGGSGNGAGEGKVTSFNYIKEDKTQKGRYAWLYSVDDTQEHGCLVFDGEGNVIENFTFGLYGGYIGSYSFHDGLIYFSYHGGERFNYAVDARPGKDHVLQANAW